MPCPAPPLKVKWKHSFHRCWTFKRNADVELHLSFQNIASSLNSECVTLSTDGALLRSPRLCFYGMALHKEGRMAAFTERSGVFSPHLWHSLLSPQQGSLSRRPLENQKSLRVGKVPLPNLRSLLQKNTIKNTWLIYNSANLPNCCKAPNDIISKAE